MGEGDPSDLVFRQLGEPIYGAIETRLQALEPRFSPWRILVALTRTLRGNSVLIGELDYTLQSVVGFVADELRKASPDDSFEISFAVTNTSRSALDVEARLHKPGRAGYTAFGLKVRRLGRDTYLLRNR